MSPLGIIGTLFSLFSSNSTGSASQSNPAGSKRASITEHGDFSSSLSSKLASLQGPSASSTPGFALNNSKTSSAIGIQPGSTDLRSILNTLHANQELPPNWRKLSELSQPDELKENLTAIASAAQSLAGINASMDTESIKSHLQSFATKYNEWIGSLEGTTKTSGLQAGMQTIEASFNKLEQNLEKIFGSAKSSIQRLSDFGLTIDPNTNLASVDTAHLDMALTVNKTDAVNAVRELSAKFSKPAELTSLSNDFSSRSTAYLDRALAAYAQISRST